MKRVFSICRRWLYYFLVERNGTIKKVYQGYVQEHQEQHRANRLASWRFLIACNFRYRLLGLPPPDSVDNLPYLEGSESSLSVREPPAQFADTLLEFDIISFDVFDTLLFRPLAKPADLFYLVGEKLSYLNFHDLRVDAELKARRQKNTQRGTDEVDIYEIYAMLERQTGICAEEGVHVELAVEKELLYPNPYMKEVFERLREQNKKLVVTSDMYIPSHILRDILDGCGYGCLDEIFVSCEHGCGKHDGRLFGLVRERMGTHLRYAHIGDNLYSDVQQAQKNGFTAYHYPNVGLSGGKYRTKSQSAVIGSAYAGIVNAHLHNGQSVFSSAYEYGFVYGGLFVLGYCYFIQEYVSRHQIDKILFLARDGDIIKQVYDKLFPQSHSRYVYWSRLAAAKLGAKRFKYDYLRRFVMHKVDTGTTVSQALSVMELDCLSSRILVSAGLSGDQPLSGKAAERLIDALLIHWEDVLQSYEPMRQAAKSYMQEVIGQSGRVCTVDVGWAGSGGVILADLVENQWSLPCKVFGIIAGTNTPHNEEPNASEPLLASGRMTAYLYSQAHNRGHWQSHNPDAGHNIFFEMLLASPTRPFTGFAAGTGMQGYRLLFDETASCDSPEIHDIQKGIHDFVNLYSRAFEKYPYLFRISGSDAYAAFQAATAKNGVYLRKIFGGCLFDQSIGGGEQAIVRQIN